MNQVTAKIAKRAIAVREATINKKIELEHCYWNGEGNTCYVTALVKGIRRQYELTTNGVTWWAYAI